MTGLAGILLGGLLFGQWWAWENGSTFSYFYRQIVLETQFYRDSILTASTLFNVLLFWAADRLGWLKVARGILAVILLTVPFIVYFQSTAGL